MDQCPRPTHSPHCTHKPLWSEHAGVALRPAEIAPFAHPHTRPILRVGRGLRTYPRITRAVDGLLVRVTLLLHPRRGAVGGLELGLVLLGARVAGVGGRVHAAQLLDRVDALDLVRGDLTELFIIGHRAPRGAGRIPVRRNAMDAGCWVHTPTRAAHLVLLLGAGVRRWDHCWVAVLFHPRPGAVCCLDLGLVGHDAGIAVGGRRVADPAGSFECIDTLDLSGGDLTELLVIRDGAPGGARLVPVSRHAAHAHFGVVAGGTAQSVLRPATVIIWWRGLRHATRDNRAENNCPHHRHHRQSETRMGIEGSRARTANIVSDILSSVFASHLTQKLPHVRGHTRLAIA